MPQAICHVEAFFRFVKCTRSPMESVILEAGKNVEMVMPDVLIASRSIVLTRGDALAIECIQQRVRDQTGRAKERCAEVIGNLQNVFVVSSRSDQAVAADPGVMVKRYEGENSRFHQDDRRVTTRLIKRGGQVAERALVIVRRVSHVAQVITAGSLHSLERCQVRLTGRQNEISGGPLKNDPAARMKA